MIQLIESKNKKLGRHINHDPRSWNYKLDTRFMTIQSTNHVRHIPILDQGDVGSCTGNAGIGSFGTDPYYSLVKNNIKYSLDEAGALKLYSDAETIDGDGPYPPNDNGSTGLSIAKALKNAGLISGYQHTFTLDDALKALSTYPIMIGSYWYDAMFNPDTDGRVHISGSVAGGHEYLCRRIDVENKLIWCDNSWGTNWGVAGKFYLTFNDFGTLLSRHGDVIILLPAASPPPTPSDPDKEMATAAINWLKSKGYTINK